MFGLVGDENPVVIDSLWNKYKTNEESEEQTEFFKMDIAIGTSKLTDDEVDRLIDDLDSISFSRPYYARLFAVEYDNLPENKDDKVVTIELHGGEVPEDVYCDVIDYLNDFPNITYGEV